jgi:hypothetical protein
MSTGSVNTPDVLDDDAASLNEILRSEINRALEWSEELDDVAARVAALEAARDGRVPGPTSLDCC